MNKMRRSVLSISLAGLMLLIWPASALAATDPGLLTAGNFAVLAGTTITNTGPSWISGAIGAGAAGIAPGSFPPGTAGPQHTNDGVYTTAQADLVTAYANAVQPCTVDYSGVNLGGLILTPGVYCQTSGATPSPTLTGTLTLNGSGIYIFLIGTTAAPTTLVTASAASIVLINGAQACQVFWRVTSSATIATSTTFVGNIMALQSIGMFTGATLNGRALAQVGAVTLQTNRIIQPTGCGYAAPAVVSPPAGNTLPATLAPFAAGPVLPGNTGVPADLRGQFNWLILLALGAGLGATVMGVSSRRRRRRRI